VANEQNFQVNPKIICENIDGEVIMINLDKGLYYSMHQVAAQVWGLLEKGAQTEQIINTLVNHYKANTQAVANDIKQLLEQLAKVKLVAVVSELQQSTQSFELTDAPATYSKPQLEEYTDMQELLLIDPVHQVDDEGWPHRLPETETKNEEA